MASNLTGDSSSSSCCCSGGGGNKRVLSIQSHVVSGYVGNKAAVFPLQLLGFDVDVINSVQFSNHTGYPFGWEGEVLDGSKLEKLISGMERNGLLSSCDCPNSDGRIGNILTGYIGSESFLTVVVNVVQKLKRLNPKCRYICDPVLGDMGKFYVPKELVEVYRMHVLPLADVITPNQFEVEQLTGITIQSIQDAQRACRVLHDVGVEIVLITSIVFPEKVGNISECSDKRDEDIKNEFGLVPPHDSIGMFTSRRTRVDQTPLAQDREKTAVYIDEQHILYTPKLVGQFTGTGDVCSAIFLGLTADNNHTSLACSLEKLAGSMHAIVKRTANAAEVKHGFCSSMVSDKANAVSSLELQLIQSRDDIISPPHLFRALRVPSQDETKSVNV